MSAAVSLLVFVILYIGAAVVIGAAVGAATLSPDPRWRVVIRHPWWTFACIQLIGFALASIGVTFHLVGQALLSIALFAAATQGLRLALEHSRGRYWSVLGAGVLYGVLPQVFEQVFGSSPWRSVSPIIIIPWALAAGVASGVGGRVKEEAPKEPARAGA